MNHMWTRLDGRKWRTLAAILLVCSLGFVLLDCGPTVECDANKACPTGKRCDANKCVDETAKDGGDVDTVGPADTNQDDAPPIDRGNPETTIDSAPENPPKDEGGGLTIYLWSKATSGTTVDLFGVSLVSETHAWAVGAKGTILHSSDSGQSWTPQASGITSTLRCVWFVNQTEGYAAGDDGVILKTKDGGKAWDKLTSTTGAIHRIQFLTEQTGYAIGDGFSFLATRDGGSTWQPQSQNLQFDLLGMHFIDRLTGYVVGSRGLIFYTRDAGKQVTTVPTGTQDEIRGVHFPDTNNGWAVGVGGLLVKSDNRGESWQKTPSGSSEDLHQIFFLSLQRGWLIGNNGTLLGTRDAGKTWRKEVAQPYPDLHDLSINSESKGVIVGKAGTILWLKPENAVCAPGQEQECYSGPAGTKGVGTCLPGKQICEGGAWGPCTGEVLPEPKEICFNDKDDNCNGKDDVADGCAACQDNDTTPCYTGAAGTSGTGECRSGVKVCKAGVFGACEQETIPKEESCDGKDNDCDGKIDNDILDKNKPACTLFYGVCAAAKRSCVGGKWVDCTDADYGPDYQKVESGQCDGKDNDCDDAVDEGCACPTEGETRKCYDGPSGTLDVGVCAAGTQTCTGGKWTDCQQMVKPSREICGDSKDNDCDKLTDEETQYALSFNSQQTAHVIVADDVALQPAKGLTLEGWFYFSGLGTRGRQRALISKAESGGYGLYVDWPSTGDISLRVWPSGGTAYTVLTKAYKGVIDLRKWVHIAGTYDGKELRLWVDGKQIGSLAFTSDIGYGTKTVPLIFGAESGDGGIAQSAMLFFGEMAQIRVAGTALYTADFTPDCQLKDATGVIGLWDMDEGSGSTAKDTKGKHDGTIKAATWDETIRCPGFHPGGCKAP